MMCYIRIHLLDIKNEKHSVLGRGETIGNRKPCVVHKCPKMIWKYILDFYNIYSIIEQHIDLRNLLCLSRLSIIYIKVVEI